jgi:tetratricopeptide (TPR) repeat protein
MRSDTPQRWGLLVALLVLISPVRLLAQMSGGGDDERQSAFTFEQQGETEHAQSAWQAVLKSHPNDAEANAHLGLLEAHQEHYANAVSFYKKAAALDPAMPGLQLNLGLALFKNGELKEATQIFSTLLKTEPADSPETLRLTTLIGLAEYGSGEYAAAVPHLRKATSADPQNLPFRLALAHSCLRSAQYQCVLDVYKEILMLNAESAEADMLAGEALDEMKDRTAAIEQFRAAVKADPKMPEAHFGLGYLLWCQLQFEDAAKEFQVELDLNPNHVQALTYLGDIQLKLNHPEAALAPLEKAIRIDPKDQLAHLDLGILHIDAGRNDDALRELKTAEQLDPNDQNVHFRLGRFYKSLGKTSEANAEFEKTRILQKASDESVLKKLHPGDSSKPEAATPSTVPSN